MKMLSGLLLAVLLVAFANVASAHPEIRSALQKKYSGLAISCEACHPHGEAKKDRNTFGRLLSDQLAGKDVAKRLAALKDPANQAKRAELLDALMADFAKAVEKVDELKHPGGQTYAERLKAGEMEGASKRGR